MNFLAPGWFWLGLLAIPIILMYMLKLRREEVKVPSTLLWEMVLQDKQANTPWQKLRRNILLLLQLLILTALVFCLTRPVIPTETITKGSVIILLDSSASMQASDILPNRFEAARREATNIINGLNPDAQLTLILVRAQPDIIAVQEKNRNRVLYELLNYQVSNEEADWQAAVAIAAGAARNSQSAVIIISDGGIPDVEYAQIPAQIIFKNIGTQSDNLGISAFAITPSLNGANLFTKVTNYSGVELSAILSFYFDDILIDARQINVPAEGESNFVINDLPDSPGGYRAQLTAALNAERVDSLLLDDSVYAVYSPQNEGRTLLISEGNFFLEQILVALPNITPFQSLADGNELLDGDFDITIFDGLIPDQLPSGNIIFINPTSNPLFEVGDVIPVSTIGKTTEHPLSQFLFWGEVHIKQTRKITLPEWGQSLVTLEDTPLVFIGETGGRRIAVVGFDLHDSDLPLQITFPILFSSLLDFLNPSIPFEPAEAIPGEAITIRSPLDEYLIVSDPIGQQFNVPITENGGVFSQTSLPGIYTVENGTDIIGRFAVNPYSIQESAIFPTTTLPEGLISTESNLTTQEGEYELWPWFAFLAIIILMIEWAIFHQSNLTKRRPISQWITAR